MRTEVHREKLFEFGNHNYITGAVIENSENVEYYLTTLEYFHEYDYLNDGKKLPKGVWLDVGFLLDSPAVDLIYTEADPHILDAYIDHCREDYTEPEDYE